MEQFGAKNTLDSLSISIIFTFCSQEILFLSCADPGQNHVITLKRFSSSSSCLYHLFLTSLPIPSLDNFGFFFFFLTNL